MNRHEQINKQVHKLFSLTVKEVVSLLSETQEVLKLVEWGDSGYCDLCDCYKDGGHERNCQLSNLINKINSLLEG